MRVGVVGLGLLGNAIARRLLAAGIVVCGHDLEETKTAALAARALAAGWGFVEAPLSGTSAQVLAGEGVGLIAGAPEALKDLRLMQAEGERIGQPLPLLAVHAALLDACVARGEGALDSSVVAEELRRRGAGRQGGPR